MVNFIKAAFHIDVLPHDKPLPLLAGQALSLANWLHQLANERLSLSGIFRYLLIPCAYAGRTQNIMHALHFNLNERRFKLRHHGWIDDASIERHELYSNVKGYVKRLLSMTENSNSKD